MLATYNAIMGRSQSSRIHNIGFSRPEATDLYLGGQTIYWGNLLPAIFKVTRFCKQSNPKCVIDGITLIKNGYNLSFYSTSFSTIKAVKTLTRPRYLDEVLMLLVLEKPMFCSMYSSAQWGRPMRRKNLFGHKQDSLSILLFCPSLQHQRHVL